jgi:hypothetical protein
MPGSDNKQVSVTAANISIPADSVATLLERSHPIKVTAIYTPKELTVRSEKPGPHFLYSTFTPLASKAKQVPKHQTFSERYAGFIKLGIAALGLLLVVCTIRLLRKSTNS